MPFTDPDVVVAFPEFNVAVPELGRGTFKVAYRIDGTAGPGVLKVLLEAVDLDADDFDAAAVSDRFTRELRGMEAINSVNVVKIMAPPELRMIGGQNFVFYLEPFYAGGTLRTRLASGPLGVDGLTRLGVDLLRGVDALWTPHEIVHRDIKPGNIVYDADGNAVLLDLGIALYTTLSELTDSGQSSPRTDSYSSPEQFDVRRTSIIDFRTDLFLVGVVLYEAATGIHPFVRPGLSIGQYLDSMENFDVSRLDPVPIPSEMKTVIGRLLAGSPSRRYRTVGEPLAILEALA